MWHLLAAGACIGGVVFDVIAMGGLAETTKKCRDNNTDDQCGEILGLEWFLIFAVGIYLILSALLCILGKVKRAPAKVFVCASLAMFWPLIVRYADLYIRPGTTSKDELGASASGHTVMAIAIPAAILLASMSHDGSSSK
ncbi:unnamed protein product [Pedinophyceae sp. YPF-701]|nr:unnamed protein product [Pedinophyceae sp. YPF-701]